MQPIAIIGNGQAEIWRTVLFVGLAIAFIFGCRPSSDRLPVSGNVTLDGTPLTEGAIRFSSVGGALVASGAMIRDGRYEIVAEKGLPPGTYRIEITSPDNNAQPIRYRSGPNDPGVLTQPDRIPPEYNIEGKHSVDISADKKNHFVFDISSKPAR